MGRIRLGVNIDHVATVRQARRGSTPDPVAAARACARAGADSIVCHLREDRRHIQDADVARLIAVLSIPVNLEMSMASDVVSTALRLRPSRVTLVPERRQELTTEGGLDARRGLRSLRKVLARFGSRGIEVSLFIDPADEQIRAAREAGARVVELHTGEYANAAGVRRPGALRRLRRAASLAHELGLEVAAGHGLDYRNVAGIARIRHVAEVNIGFSIVSHALFVGLESAVRQMRSLLKQ